MTPAQSWALLALVFLAVFLILWVSTRVFGLGQPLHNAADSAPADEQPAARSNPHQMLAYRFANSSTNSANLNTVSDSEPTAEELEGPDAHYLDVWKDVLK